MWPIIGVDFDNTLVNYDSLINRLAIERGLVHPGAQKSKREIRDAIRQLPQGEIQWQRVQALVYGPRMSEAIPANGADMFLRSCAGRKVGFSPESTARPARPSRGGTPC